MIANDSLSAGLANTQLNRFMDAAPDAFFGMDATGTVVFVNAAAEALFGYPRGSLLGQPVERFVPPARREQVRERLAHFLANPAPRLLGQSIDIVGLREDGTEFPLESSIHIAPGPLYIMMLQDVTVPRRAGALLNHRIDASPDAIIEEATGGIITSANAEALPGHARSDLISGAHDFNNLLSIILNYAAFAEQTIATVAVDDEAHRDVLQQAEQDLQQVTNAAQGAARLMRQLPTSEQSSTIRAETLDLNEVVREMHDLLDRTIGAQAHADLSLAPDLHTVQADRGQMEQLLLNLVVNARDAMPDGGLVTIKTHNFDAARGDQIAPVVDDAASRVAGTITDGPAVLLQVSDTGGGMPPDMVARVLDLYFTTKPMGEGASMGLGLPAVYGTVMEAGGCIRISSDPGLGTTFTILLPASPDDVALTPAHEDLDRRGATVLLAEDDDALRAVVSHILTRHGYRVLAADGPDEALALSETVVGDIDVLLTDVVMHGMSGQECAERIRRTRAETRVLYMSGHDEHVIMEDGGLDEAIRLIQKPFTATALLRALRETLADPVAVERASHR